MRARALRSPLSDRNNRLKSFPVRCAFDSFHCRSRKASTERKKSRTYYDARSLRFMMKISINIPQQICPRTHTSGGERSQTPSDELPRLKLKSDNGTLLVRATASAINNSSAGGQDDSVLTSRIINKFHISVSAGSEKLPMGQPILRN